MYSTQLDWSDTVTLETETFTQATAYNALNRPTSITTPDASEIKPTYNEAGLLEKVEARIRNAVGWTTFVDDIDYDAKGQREKIVYGNGVYMEYSYDPLTYRVKRIKTTRTSDSAVLQDLRYTYDAVGNIVEMADLAQNTVYYDDDVMVPVWKYEYDALDRLINATGREHAGTSSDIQQDAYGFPLVNGASPNSPSAMRNYEESYEYDQVGNILKMIHDANSSVGDWTRYYHIADTSNRLLDTSLPGDDEEDAVYSAEYTHDAHGNMLTMPHLDGIEWDFKDQMRYVDKGGGGEVYFTYDASGQRVRKVWEHSGIVEERIYLGAFELYRRHESDEVVVERETLHINDDTRRIAMVETKTIDESESPLTITPRIRYQCSNHLGSAMLELDDGGLVISYEEYHPYGTSAYRAVDDTIEVSARRYRYTGKERDEETGLYYHGARYYACWLGRWTSADPAGMVDGVNVFVYVRNRPTGLHDPSGTEGETIHRNGLNIFEGKITNSADATPRKAVPLMQAIDNALGTVGGKDPAPFPPMFGPAAEAYVKLELLQAQPVPQAQSELRAVSPEVARETRLNYRLQEVFDRFPDEATRKQNHWMEARAKIHGEMPSQRHDRLVNEALTQIAIAAVLEGFSAWGAGAGGFALVNPALRRAAATRSTLGFGDTFQKYESGKYGVVAHLDKDGVLGFYIARGPETPSGGQMFNEALSAFGDNVKRIKGFWMSGDELADNFNSFKKALADNPKLDPKKAALEHTFTGKMASRAGFNKVDIKENTAQKVVVEFYR